MLFNPINSQLGDDGDVLMEQANSAPSGTTGVEDALASEDDGNEIRLSQAFSFIRTHHRNAIDSKASKSKPQVLSAITRTRLDYQVQNFLASCIGDQHYHLTKDATPAYEMFRILCDCYESDSSSGDPYAIQQYLQNMHYEVGQDLTKFIIKLKKALAGHAASTESVVSNMMKSLQLFNSMRETWQSEMKIWKGVRKSIPYIKLKTKLHGMAQNKQMMSCYRRPKGPPRVI